MEILLQQLVDGVLIGLVFSLLAIGLTLILGVMNVLNFAHGEFLMMGLFISSGSTHWRALIPCSRYRSTRWPSSCWGCSFTVSSSAR